MKKIIYLLIALILFICSAALLQSSERNDAAFEKEIKREIQYGRLLSKKILSRHPVYQNNELTGYVNKVGKSVAMFAGRPELSYKFAILDSDSVNAFAAPGGYIFITKGAIAQMQTEAELAAVLAHEIGHVNNKHIMKQLPPPRDTSGGFTQFLSSFLVSQGAIVSSAFNEVVNQAESLLFEDGYLIEDEYEADRSAIDYLDATGYYNRSLILFLERIDRHKKAHGDVEVYHTHPSTQGRVTRLNTYIQSKAGSAGAAQVRWRFRQFADTLD